MNHQMGSVIDTFTTVGRINNYSTSGFENYVGSKTQIWFNGANQNLKKRVQIPERVVVFIPAEILWRKGESIHERITRRLGIPRSRYELTSLKDMEVLEQKCGILRPTTGTASILWAIGQFEEVIIYGFDFFIDSKAHYNDRKWMNWLIQKGVLTKGRKHDMTSEKIFIESLLIEGKIKRLSTHE